MRACWLKWVGRDWSISADYIWLNYSDANSGRPFINLIIFTITLTRAGRLNQEKMNYTHPIRVFQNLLRQGLV